MKMEEVPKALKNRRFRAVICLLTLCTAYVSFERFGQPLWSTRWHLYLFLEGLTHLALAGCILAMMRPVDRKFFFWLPFTMVPDLDHLLWAQYRNFFHTPVFFLSPLLFMRIAGRGAVNLSVLFTVHWIFDSRSTMAWWKPESVWLLPPIGIPMLPPWVPLMGLFALWLLAAKKDLFKKPSIIIPTSRVAACMVLLALVHFLGNAEGARLASKAVDREGRTQVPEGGILTTNEQATVAVGFKGEGGDSSPDLLAVRSAPQGWNIKVLEDLRSFASEGGKKFLLSIVPKGGPPSFTETSQVYEIVMDLAGQDGKLHPATLKASLRPGVRDLFIYFGLPFFGGTILYASGLVLRRLKPVEVQKSGGWIMLCGGVISLVCASSGAGLLLIP